MSYASRFPVRGFFRLAPIGVREAVLCALSQPDQHRHPPRSIGILEDVRRWQREQPEQFAELANLILNGPQKAVARDVTEAAA